MRDATYDSRDSRLYSIIAFSVAAVVSFIAPLAFRTHDTHFLKVGILYV